MGAASGGRLRWAVIRWLTGWQRWPEKATVAARQQHLLLPAGTEQG